MLERLERIETKLKSVSGGLKNLEQKYLELEKENKKLKEVLKKLYEYKVRNRCSENAGKYKDNTSLSYEWAGVIVVLLRFLDKVLHEVGKAKENENLTLGLVRF